MDTFSFAIQIHKYSLKEYVNLFATATVIWVRQFDKNNITQVEIQAVSPRRMKKTISMFPGLTRDNKSGSCDN